MNTDSKQFVEQLNKIETLVDLEEFLKKNNEVIATNPDVKLDIGHNLKRLKGFDEALAFYSEHHQFSRSPSGLWFRGMLFQKMNNIDAAIADYRTIIDIDNNSKYMEFLLLFLAKCHVIKCEYVDASICLDSLRMILGNDFESFEAYCGSKISTSNLLKAIRRHGT